MQVATIMYLNYDENLTNRRVSLRKCKYQHKDKYRLLHSKYFRITESIKKDKTYFCMINPRILIKEKLSIKSTKCS